MKSYSVFYRDDLPYLRQNNPLAQTSNLVSEKMYAEHETLYLESAVLLLDPVDGKQTYSEIELQTQWQFFEDPYWINVSEPNLIETNPNQYRQVFKTVNVEQTSFQNNVQNWLLETFGHEVAADVPERCFRFIEEALELVQALGMSKEDVLRVVVYTFARPEGEIIQEIGGALVTLAALCSSVNQDMQTCGETEIANNWKRKDAIRQKWLNKIAVTPIK